MRQPGKTHDRIIISARQAEVLRAAVVTVHALLWLGHPPGIGCVKGRDLAARSPAITQRPNVISVGHTRGYMAADPVEHRKRTLPARVQSLAEARKSTTLNSRP